MLAAVPNITGNMRLQDELGGKMLTSGALMGLGPSWTIMSLMVGWAAKPMGNSTSHQICGDDLVALWPAHNCDWFEARLGFARLVPNKKKSFRGDAAVF